MKPNDQPWVSIPDLLMGKAASFILLNLMLKSKAG